METQGKILVDVWGYSMTIVDFYKVIKETEKSVTVLPIGAHEKADGYLQGQSTPVPSAIAFTKPSRLLKRTNRDGSHYYVGTLHKNENFKLERHYLKEWNGRPMDYNHCD